MFQRARIWILRLVRRSTVVKVEQPWKTVVASKLRLRLWLRLCAEQANIKWTDRGPEKAVCRCHFLSLCL